MVSHYFLSKTSSVLVIACLEIGFLPGRLTNVFTPHLLPIPQKTVTRMVKAKTLKGLKWKKVGFDFCYTNRYYPCRCMCYFSSYMNFFSQKMSLLIIDMQKNFALAFLYFIYIQKVTVYLIN